MKQEMLVLVQTELQRTDSMTYQTAMFLQIAITSDFRREKNHPCKGIHEAFSSHNTEKSTENPGCWQISSPRISPPRNTFISFSWHSYVSILMWNACIYLYTYIYIWMHFLVEKWVYPSSLLCVRNVIFSYFFFKNIFSFSTYENPEKEKHIIYDRRWWISWRQMKGSWLYRK